MSRPDDGGPAFPRPDAVSDALVENSSQDGMSLRDWFAGRALTGLLAFSTGDLEGCGQYKPEDAARRAYEVADAMLAERDKAVSTQMATNTK